MSVADSQNRYNRREPGSPIARVLGLRAVSDAVTRLTARKMIERFSALFMVLVIVGTAGYALVRPDYNWDMVAYIATALENRVEDPGELHRQTWAEIEPGAREAQLYHLQRGNPYNLHQWENPADFQSQLSMYRVKIAYIGLIRALEPVFGLARASIVLSLLPAIGVGFLCLYWLWRRKALQSLLVVTPLLVLADYANMTTAVGPDMLVALISLGAIMLLAAGRDMPAYFLLFLSVFVRPDNIVLIFALLIAAGLFRWRFLPMLLTFLASFAACLIIQNLGEHPGWWAHFYFSCVRIQNSMIGFSPDFALLDFVRGYVRGVVVALTDSDWPALLLLMSAGWALLARAGRMSARGNALVFALLIGTLGKFASFPLPDDRFYFAFIAGLIVILAGEWRPDFSLPAAAKRR